MQVPSVWYLGHQSRSRALGRWLRSQPRRELERACPMSQPGDTALPLPCPCRPPGTSSSLMAPAVKVTGMTVSSD